MAGNERDVKAKTDTRDAEQSVQAESQLEGDLTSHAGERLAGHPAGGVAGDRSAGGDGDGTDPTTVRSALFDQVTAAQPDLDAGLGEDGSFESSTGTAAPPSPDVSSDLDPAGGLTGADRAGFDPRPDSLADAAEVAATRLPGYGLGSSGPPAGTEHLYPAMGGAGEGEAEATEDELTATESVWGGEGEGTRTAEGHMRSPRSPGATQNDNPWPEVSGGWSGDAAQWENERKQAEQDRSREDERTTEKTDREMHEKARKAREKQEEDKKKQEEDKKKQEEDKKKQEEEDDNQGQQQTGQDGQDAGPAPAHGPDPSDPSTPDPDATPISPRLAALRDALAGDLGAERVDPRGGSIDPGEDTHGGAEGFDGHSLRGSASTDDLAQFDPDSGFGGGHTAIDTARGSTGTFGSGAIDQGPDHVDVQTDGAWVDTDVPDLDATRDQESDTSYLSIDGGTADDGSEEVVVE